MLSLEQLFRDVYLTSLDKQHCFLVSSFQNYPSFSFKMLGPDDIQSGNIEVLVSATWESESFKNIGSLSAKEFK